MSDNNAPQIKYDVFVSFRGEIRRGILSHLVDKFKSEKINAFVDDRLERGDEIWPSLVEAIQGSFILLIIFSPNYASSRWCLEELVKILECKEKYGRIVIPVFYDAEPTHVRHQSSDGYKNAFAKHERKYESKVQIWRDALNKSADLSGFESIKFPTDAVLVKEIVKVVQVELKRFDKRLGSNSKGLIGIDGKIAYVESLIRKEPENTRLIGIWGMGGIGKTTLAEQVFIRLQSDYEGYCFLENKGEKSNKLLKKIFSELLGYDVKSIGNDIVRRICGMKVLIVLDDVNDSGLQEQLLETLDNRSGSRIIVTTRDKQVLNKAHEIYPIEEFSFDEALELFNLKAFKQSDRQREYHELSNRMVHYAKGIPLVLNVLACRLCGKKKQVWESELDKLKSVPPTKVYDVMKLSYDDLDRKEKQIFLDLACFVLRLHKKVKEGYLKSLLKDDERDNSVVAGLERLKDKALITSSEDNFISMHDCLQDMGREIVHQESSKDPESRSWLWDPDDVCEALENDKGTKAIRSIQIELIKIKEQMLHPDMFTKMRGLRFLEIYSGSYQRNILAEGLQLRFLSWYSFPLTSLPENFSVEKLVILKLRGGNIQKVWDGVKNMVNLKELDLSQSQMLKELPDLSKATNLEVLLLWGCSRLTSVHPSIFSLAKLEKLDLWNCKSLIILTSDSRLRSLSYLNLDGCENLREFSVISENMKDLGLQCTTVQAHPSLFGHQRKPTSLLVEGSVIERLPSSFINLTQVLHLEVSNCHRLQTIPELPLFLETLNVRDCKLLQSLPELAPSLKILSAQSCKSLKSLPKLPESLETLDSHDCTSLQTLPELPPSLKTLSVQSCESLKSLPQLPESLETLHVHSCISLQTLPKLPLSLKTLDIKWFSKLQTLLELPPTLKTLNVKSFHSLQSLPELPLSLQTLVVHDCSPLQSLPNLPSSLETLDVQWCSKLLTLPELPASLKTLDVHWCSSLQNLPELSLSLQTLDVNCCTTLQTLPELPPTLETLDVHFCTSLQTLPQLPLFLKSLNAKACESLKTVLFPSTAVDQSKENRTQVLFMNCLNLGEHFQVDIGLNAQVNVMKFANQHLSTANHDRVENYKDYDHKYCSYQAVYVYPGSSFPEWLEFKTRNDYIIIDLASAPPSPLPGFIFCFFLGKYQGNIMKRLEVNITISDGEGEGKKDSVRMYIDYWDWSIESDHVCVIYDQRCSAFLNSRAGNQTRFKIRVSMGIREYYSGTYVPAQQMLKGFGVRLISSSTHNDFIQQMELRD